MISLIFKPPPSKSGSALVSTIKKNGALVSKMGSTVDHLRDQACVTRLFKILIGEWTTQTSRQERNNRSTKCSSLLYLMRVTPVVAQTRLFCGPGQLLKHAECRPEFDKNSILDWSKKCWKSKDLDFSGLKSINLNKRICYFLANQKIWLCSLRQNFFKMLSTSQLNVWNHHSNCPFSASHFLIEIQN